MKEVLFGIFAHPDDEAFEPSAYLLRRVKHGADLHLIMVTDGGLGENVGHDDLVAVRHEEWLESGRRIGATSNLALGYRDGSLCNALYLEIADKILNHIDEVLAEYNEPTKVSFVTFEERGITGHLDHVAVSMITTYCFEKLKAATTGTVTIDKLMYYCLPEVMASTCNCDWIYMPAGRSDSEIDEQHAYEDLYDEKLHIMSAHVSQKRDMEHVLHRQNHAVARNKKQALSDHFIVRK